MLIDDVGTCGGDAEFLIVVIEGADAKANGAGRVEGFGVEGELVTGRERVIGNLFFFARKDFALIGEEIESEDEAVDRFLGDGANAAVDGDIVF